MRSRARESEADRVSLFLADGVLESAADHGHDELLPDGGEGPSRPTREPRSRVLERVFELAPECD